METTKEGITYLTQLFKSYDWFDSAGLDKFGRYQVFVNYINEDIKRLIPDTLDNKRVFWDDVLFKPGNIRKKYITEINLAKSSPTIIEEEIDIETLTKELDRLEKICGPNILSDLFFETHDKQNSITNLSSKFPEVRYRLEKLYDTYGFDILYDQLEL